jgi:alternate signal-mediated exported protein
MTSKSTKRRNSIIAAVAGAALLVGGSTYALWSATASIDGGTITAGDLDLEAGTLSAWDVSEDRTDIDSDGVATAASSDPEFAAVTLAGLSGHLIDSLDTWRMVPGDTVALLFPYKITLVGDNLVAALEMPGVDTLIGTTTDFFNNAANLVLEYQIFDADGVALGARAPLEDEDFQVAYFQANGTGQDNGIDD